MMGEGVCIPLVEPEQTSYRSPGEKFHLQNDAPLLGVRYDFAMAPG